MQCVFDEIPQGTLPSRPVLELNVVHIDVLSDDVEVPRIQDAHVTHPYSDARDDDHLLTIDLAHFASAREVTPSQQFVAHNDVQISPQDSPLVVRSISDDTATFL